MAKDYIYPHQIRQGDVLLIPATELNVRVTDLKVARENGKLILAYGEQTGHSHAIADEDVEMFETFQAIDRYLDVKNRKGATLVHEEHGSLHIPPGQYVVRQQRQLDPKEDTEPRAIYD